MKTFIVSHFFSHVKIGAISSLGLRTEVDEKTLIKDFLFSSDCDIRSSVGTIVEFYGVEKGKDKKRERKELADQMF
jgi:hypothetical protein